MPFIETIADIVEEMADKIGIYGAHEYEGDNCRVCFTVDLSRRVKEAVANEIKLGTWALLLCALILPAAPILSDGNEICTPAPCTVQTIIPHPAWINSTWISYTDSGAHATLLAVPNNTIVSFYETIITTQPVLSAPLQFAADDSAALYVNNSLVIPAAPILGNAYTTCSDTAPTCWAWTYIDIAPWLTTGTNILRFDVEQRGRYAFGLTFSGSLQEVPEPTTWPLVTGGLILFFGIFYILDKWQHYSTQCKLKDYEIERYRYNLQHIANYSDEEYIRNTALQALKSYTQNP